MDETYVPRLKALYEEKVRASLVSSFGYKNVMEVPKCSKIVVNMGVGGAVHDRKKITQAMADLALIAGQKPVVAKARKSVASFKLREGMSVGCKVTLRRWQMYEFLDRLVSIALPQVHDFRGLNPKSFDGCGNFSMGIKEHIVFPEIAYDTVDETRGMDICICTTSRTDEEALALLQHFGMPFPRRK